ncbi:protein LONGIFOLIA 1-like [Punica granatum]|uniref:DUF4378 domain-containing protein n=2 Tax=Punica granatum TaxID=22663 RepID=A0A218VX05_PUNGR|nr:protein LONGIFOLIA 1-like [Punica granatum]OWM64521.1 hypothetical protein CDL15_Pgr020488 [Punica granatum]PKI32959.1 hypothetical protein CRG98_046633 [Punica granatum]
MSAKLLYSIADDNPSVQKQIGCMNGLFQLFDRNHFLSSRRISKDPNKRLPEGREGKDDAVANESSQKAAVVKNPKVITEKQRISTDSSRSSVSSSCNTLSFSSLDDSRSLKSERVENSSYRLNSSAEVPITRDQPLHRLNGLDGSGRQPLTTHRNVRGITVKCGNKDESPTLTYIDSPRPMQKPNKSSKPRFSSLQESLGVLPNFRKLRPSSNSMEHSRKDSPRLSYDGRESRDALKSSARLKELPRHSLDSKRGSMIGSPQIRHSDLPVDSPREVGSHRRQSSLVAKLMGLEALPDPMSAPEELTSIDSGEAFDFSRSSRISNCTSWSSHQKETISQQVIHPNFPKKSNPAARFPMEPAPWKKPEGKQSSEAPQNSSRSVYGEIEKRLAQLEFKKSGKDLRALKQILEAMQKSHEKLNAPKEVGSSNISPQTRKGNSTPEQRPNLAVVPRNIICESPTSPTTRRTSSPKTSPSSIVIMKPATARKSNNGPRTEERVSPRNCSGGRTVSMEKNITCRDTSREAVSPRLQKKKFNSSDYSQRRSSLSGGQRRSLGHQDCNQKSRTNSLQLGGYDQGSEISGDSISRDLSDRNNSASLRSESNISVSSWEEAEVTSTYRGECGMRKKVTSILREDIPSIRKPQITTAEQPSPISVLDATLYGDESPSPVKMISNAFEDVGDESQWDQEDLKCSKEGSFRTEIYAIGSTKTLPPQNDTGNNYTNPDHRYISEILSASGMLQDLDYGSLDFQPNQPGHLFNKNLFLALEQIKASNRLPKGIQEIPRLNCGDRLQRRLLFDVVNEILVEKFIRSHSKNWLGLEKREHNQQQLLHGLCSEIDQLQAKSSSCSSDEEDDGLRHIVEKELSNQTAVWADGFGNISGVVLDIERLIFKDLISEVVSGAAGHTLRARPPSYCRQLF